MSWEEYLGKDDTTETTDTETVESGENFDTETVETDENFDTETVETDDDFETETVEYDGESQVKASRRTTVVLLGIIAVLVVIIAVFAVLFVLKLKENKEKEQANPTGTPAVTTPAAAGTDDGTETGSETAGTGTTDDSQSTGTQVAELREFNVTTTLGQYKGLEAEYSVREITDEEIEIELETFIEDLTDLVEVTGRAVESGDTVNIDFTGYMDGEAFDGGTGTDFDLEIGSGQFIPGFEDALIGANVGDTVDVNISFPDPYENNPDYSGKPVLFVVTINSISEYVTPELSDETIAENTDGEYSTIGEYKEYIRGYLTEQAEEEAEADVASQLSRAVIERTEYSSEIEEEIDYYVQMYIEYYDSVASSYYGIDGATYFYYIAGVDPANYETWWHDQLDESLRYQHALDEIIKLEGLTLTDEEYQEAYAAEFYDYYGFTSEEEVNAQFTEKEIEEIVVQPRLREKADMIVRDSAVVNGRPEGDTQAE